MSTAMMKAYIYHGPENMSLDQVPKPKILHPKDAIVKVTTSTICGTDKHIRHGGLRKWNQAGSSATSSAAS